MNLSTIKTPGVYINEVNGFAGSVVPVATAVPAFIGYTPRAEYEGKSYFNKPQKITSFQEFQAIYMDPNAPAPADPAKQYKPNYHLVQQKEEPTKGDSIKIDGKYFSILPDPSSIYYLYNSIKMFYANGGGDCYIVSVGTYGPVVGKPMETVGAQIINPNVKLTDLQRGLELLNKEEEPTMYVCPDAVLMERPNHSTLMQQMLLQCQKMQTAVAIFDIIGGDQPDPIMFSDDIEAFRNGTGNSALKYGVSYYPFIQTTAMQPAELDYTNLFNGDVKQLLPLLNPASAPNAGADKILNSIIKPAGEPLTIDQYNSALMNASGTYALIMKQVLKMTNLLPPSGAIAGVYTTIDNNIGVWKAPANVSPVGVVDLPIKLSSSQQENLNIDAVTGKSINALRFFNGKGILIWGARTLDGNSLDWRYVSVRRTMIMLEQSVKLAAQKYVFDPNNAETWLNIKNEISSFLTSIWNLGGLQGAVPADAFSVECGLGSTMTPEDLLNGFLNVSVKVAVVRPAEFIVITFQQQMAKS